MRARRAWIAIHKWLGLILGTLLALIGLTGSLSVFQREIDAWANPALFIPGPGPARAGAAEALAAALAEDRSGRVSIIRLPDPVWPVIVVNQTRRGPDGPRLWTVHVDPASGRVLGSRDFEASLPQQIFRLHANLLLKPLWGRLLVGSLGLLALFSIGSGLWLWWPREGLGAAMLRLRRRPSQLLLLDLHKLVGAWLGALLVLSAATGAWLGLPGVIGPVIGLVTPVRDAPPVAPDRFAWPPAIDASAAQARAEAALPGSEAGYLSPPHPGRNSWQVGLRPMGSDPRLRSRSLAWIDPASGAVLGLLGEGHGPLGARMHKDLIWLHSGALFGLGGRLLALLAGLALPALWISGLLLWLRRRQLRQLTAALRLAALREGEGAPRPGAS
ncbi:PepSY-associated TM helix domain-containing protein [Roseicella frigidaeris]|uniref:PepSY domain-containing protein n=1 Tax=Roseicella frigidaeris TaxID=2230885 RepID=A0A327M9Z6_9PROT|nr:PepSY-associated TM helix domain-containing protein [Roseicella frigidaeris]RAI59589.1 PepSY domain-containing protein [Roseicella frigidaeris]